MQEQKLVKEINSCREKGLVVDSEYTQARGKQIVRKDKPVGWETFNSSTGWKDNFVKRNNLTSQVRTSKKAVPLDERIQKILRRDQYTVYGMAYVLPSV